MPDLQNKRCVPCETYVPPLLEDKENELLKELNNWTINRNEPLHKLVKNFEYKDFKKAISFINKVADIANEEGHHPDIFISYNKVTLTLFTHFIKGLHENDFVLAAKIDHIS